jgi:membrane protein
MMIERAAKFFTSDIWVLRLRELSPVRAFLIRQLRIIALSLRLFLEDQCPLRASALTFYTFLSFIPIMAMALGIAKGFDLENAIERQVLEHLKGQEEVARWVISFAHSFLQNIKGGLLAGIGVALLFWTVIRVLNTIEISFNAIWKTSRQRTFVRKISDYLSIMLISPILLILSSSLTVVISTEVGFIVQKIVLLRSVSAFIYRGLQLLPYVVTWLLFTFIYTVMPNVKVHLKAGLLGGIVAGTLYQIFQWLYIAFQVGVSSYNAVYGSFAALPLFLVWLQASWLIVLYGAEIAFARQNVEQYELEPIFCKASSAFKKLLALNIVHLVVKRFHNGEPGCSTNEIARLLDLPVLLTQQIVSELVASGVLAVSGGRENERCSAGVANADTVYQPALDIEKLTIKYVIDALDQRGVGSIPLVRSPEFNKIAECLGGIGEVMEKSPSNRLLRDI